MLVRVDRLQKDFQLYRLGGKVIRGCPESTFEVDRGEFLSLLGSNGSGKSTILKCIYRTYLPTGGTIEYESLSFGRVNLTTLEDHQMIVLRDREIGYVSQFLKVIPRVPALEVVADPLLRKNGISQKEARQKAAEVLERLRLPSHLFDAYPTTFSGGEQQKVNLARAILWQPRLLLLDEPTASLDHRSVRLVFELLQDLKKQGTTMIGIFHDEPLIQSISDRIYQLDSMAMERYGEEERE